MKLFREELNEIHSPLKRAQSADLRGRKFLMHRVAERISCGTDFFMVGKTERISASNEIRTGFAAKKRFY
jgi:hypothetical protein